MSKRKNNKKLVSSIFSIIVLIIFAVLSQNEEIQSYIGANVSNSSKNELVSNVKDSEDGTKTIVIGSGNINNQNNLNLVSYMFFFLLHLHQVIIDRIYDNSFHLFELLTN